ncbi:MAG: terminase family protein [Clostridiaceae bacterium]|nr:terminase family protein [Clostridiaceae bacterium]
MNDREIISKLLKIEAEQKERAKDTLAAYNRDRVHEKQMAFHRCLKRNRWMFGGNRSGKTECGAVECVWLARGIHPYRANRPDVFGWVVSVSYEVQRDVAQAKVLKYLKRSWISDIVMCSGKKGAPEYGIIDHIVVKNVFGGFSRIGFKSADQGREKFQGASLDFVWFDEEPPVDIYEECRMRILDKRGELFGTMTPLKGLTWVYDEIYLNERKDAEIWYIQAEWRDNPYLDAAEVESFIKSMSEEAQESRRFGRFRDNAGLVYGEFDQSVHVIEPFSVPREWYAGISIDPGLHNPLSAHFYAADYDGNLYVIAEHYESGRTVAYHADKIKRLADTLHWRRDGKGRIEALIDSAANQRTLASSKSVAELFNESGILVNTRVNKDLFAGIARVKSLLAHNPPRLFIFKSCPNLIREIKSYWWGDGDRPKKADDHALDELRYFVMSRPENVAPKAPRSEIEKDKDGLVRRARSKKFYK